MRCLIKYRVNAIASSFENLKPSSLLSLPKITDLVIQLNSGLIDAIILEKNVAESYVKANSELAMANIDFSNSRLLKLRCEYITLLKDTYFRKVISALNFS